MKRAESLAEPDPFAAHGESFEEFYRHEHSAQGASSRRALILGDDTANDVVHDAFTTLFARWASVSAPGPYLQRMVLNGCRDHARRTQLPDRIGWSMDHTEGSRR